MITICEIKWDNDYVRATLKTDHPGWYGKPEWEGNKSKIQARDKVTSYSLEGLFKIQADKTKGTLTTIRKGRWPSQHDIFI